MAEKQIKGEELTSLIADKLATIDARAKSFRAEETFQTDWGNDIKIEVPGAGISFSELDRLLRKKLGNQTRVGGTLYYSESALRLSLRTGEGEAVDVAGEAAKIDELCQRAAEAVVGQLQPYKYSKYLEFAGRTDKAMRVVRKSANEGSANERAWAWAQISNLLSATDIPAAYDAGIQAKALDPNIGLGYLNAANAAVLMGHDEILHALGNQAIDLFRHGGGSLSEIGINTGSGNRAVLDAYTEGDYGKAIDILKRTAGPLYRGVEAIRESDLADAYTKTHDLKSSEQIKNVWTDARAISSLYVNDVYISPQFDRAVALDDWPAALSASQSQLDALASNPEGSELASYARARFVLPNMAFALAQSGRLAEAQKIAAASPKDCYLCERTTAWVVGLGGDMVQAARDYSDAINQNASLPFADFEWGKLLLLKGDLSGAAAHFERSAKLGPRFADPLKIWGDVLLVQGKSREALSNYALAADRAPRWGGLHLNWSKALWASGEKGDAQRKLAAAARMDLAASEKLELLR